MSTEPTLEFCGFWIRAGLLRAYRERHITGPELLVLGLIDCNSTPSDPAELAALLDKKQSTIVRILKNLKGKGCLYEIGTEDGPRWKF